MKTVGVIGGFGPEATAGFYLQLVSEYRKRMNGQQPHIIVWNVSVPRTLEHEALVAGRNLHRFLPLLTTAASSLERAGVDVVVLPCNTLHVLESQIRATIHVPFISIIKASIQSLRHQNITRVGLLGSQITVKENLFARSSPDITFSSVHGRIQKEINEALDHFVKTHDPIPLRVVLRKALLEFGNQQITNVLIACTDFHGLFPKIPGMTFHDTLDMLVAASVKQMVGNTSTSML